MIVQYMFVVTLCALEGCEQKIIAEDAPCHEVPFSIGV